MLNRQACCPSEFSHSTQVYVHIVEAMDEIFHENYLAVFVKFEQAHGHNERVVSEAIDFSHHDLHRWHLPQHRIRRHQRRRQAIPPSIPSFPEKASSSKLEEA